MGEKTNTSQLIVNMIHNICKSYNVSISDFDISFDCVPLTKGDMFTVDIQTSKFKQRSKIVENSNELYSGCFFEDDFISEEYEVLFEVEFASLKEYLENFRNTSFFNDTDTCRLEKLKLVEDINEKS